MLATAASFDLNYGAVRRPSGPATARVVNHLRLGEALLDATDPPIRALFVAANNPAITNPDTAKMRQGLAREDLFTVVLDPFMTETARYADIVLPATTYLETEDFYRSYGSYYMQYGHKAVEPAGEAWSNLRVTQTLAARLGLTDSVFRMSPPEILQELFKDAGIGMDPTALLDGKAVSISTKSAQQFRTPSGKLEFYSEQLAKQGISPVPDWNEDPVDAAEARKWPLRLLTAPGYFQAHTAFSGVGFLREREGKPFCVLHPDDAKKRGLGDGAAVRLFNGRGEIGLELKVSDEIQPGVVLVPGQRPTSEAISGTINMLCSDRYTDMGEGATYQSTWLDVGPWKSAAE